MARGSVFTPSGRPAVSEALSVGESATPEHWATLTRAAIEMVAHSDHANESDQAISHIAGTEA